MFESYRNFKIVFFLSFASIESDGLNHICSPSSFPTSPSSPFPLSTPPPPPPLGAYCLPLPIDIGSMSSALPHLQTHYFRLHWSLLPPEGREIGKEHKRERTVARLRVGPGEFTGSEKGK